jgi:CRISPR-associated protein Cmr2
MKYIGITIGPIYDTIHKAQKTKEIWGASYIFSYLCKEILKQVDESLYDILLPDKSHVSDTNPGVGLYPDRILLGLKNGGSFDHINQIVKKTKTALSDKLWDELVKDKFSYGEYEDHIKKYKSKEAEIKKYFFDYFKACVIEVDEIDLDFVNDENKPIGIVKSLNLYLDNAELIPTLAHFDPDPFHALLQYVNHTFIVKDAFNEKHKSGFPSLAEIATNELQFVPYDDKNDTVRSKIRSYLLEKNEPKITGDSKNVKPEDEDESLSKIFAIPETKEHLRTYHKYIAIVHADGDNMGQFIGQLKENSEVKDFSSDLISFAIQANKILAGERFTKGSDNNWGYGAAPVYIGGDDLVFFAPVASINEKGEYKTIFDLINDIDQKFNEIFNAQNSDKSYLKYPTIASNRPCLSYGVSITYYKFPLREAYEQSLELMRAVKTDEYPTRNRMHFILQKHSKQIYSGIIDKNFEQAFKNYRELLNRNKLKSPLGEDSDKFLNSIYQKILENENQYLDTNIEDLTDLFSISYNEKIHSKYKDYLKDVRLWIEDMFKNQGYTSDTLHTIVSMLKMIHFIRDNEFRN